MRTTEDAEILEGAEKQYKLNTEEAEDTEDAEGVK